MCPPTHTHMHTHIHAQGTQQTLRRLCSPSQFNKAAGLVHGVTLQLWPALLGEGKEVSI